MTNTDIHTIPLASTKEAAPGEQLMLAFQAPAPCAVVDARVEAGVEIIEIIAGSKKAKREDGDVRSWTELLGGAPVPPNGYIMIVVKNVTEVPKLLAAELLIAPIAVAQVVPGSAPFAQGGPPRSVAEPFMRTAGAPPRGPVNQPFMRQPGGGGSGGIQTRVIPGGKRSGNNGPVIPTRVIPGGKRSGNAGYPQPSAQSMGPMTGNVPFTPIGRVVPQQAHAYAAPQVQPQAAQRGPYVMRPNSKATGINVRRVVTARGKSARQVVGRKSAVQMRAGAAGFGHAPTVLVAPGPGERAVAFRPGHAHALLQKVEHNVVIPKTHVAPILRALALGPYEDGPKSTGGSDIAVCFKAEHLSSIATVAQHSGARLQEPVRSEVVHALKEAFARLESVSRRNVQAPSPIAVASDAFVEHVEETTGESESESSDVANVASGES